MTLPPERITVKRRREDEPVGALYVNSKKSRPSGVWTLASDVDDQIVYAQPVPPPHCSQETQSHSLKPTQVPTVGTTLPSEGISTQRQHASRSPEVNPPSGEKSRPSALTRPVRRGQEPQERAIAPRRFHLAKNSLKVPSPYAVSKASAQRHAKPMKNELAVFVEAGKAFKDKSRPRINAGNGERRNELGDNIRRKIEGSETPRKRPNATAVERKWRAENWKERREPQASTEQHERSACNVSQPSHEWDYESPELAAQLQKIAFQETKAPEEHLEGHQDGQYLKIKPKPPKPRQPALDIRTNEEDESRDEVMADANSVDDDTDYVFDTYIRSVAQPCSIIDAGDPFLNSLHGTNPSDMGLLIIEDGEEEELWETFGEDKDSDPERNSEEEDENAEDFYGNDYPEDEVDSDDEFGRGSYNYRHDASDDEQFGDEEPNWSDDELSAYHP